MVRGCTYASAVFLETTNSTALRVYIDLWWALRTPQHLLSKSAGPETWLTFITNVRTVGANEGFTRGGFSRQVGLKNMGVVLN